jgi:tetratricopeptide (TPR) repeat protein
MSLFSRYGLSMVQNRILSLLGFVLLCFAAPCLCQSVSDTQQQVEVHLQEAHRLLSENKPEAAIPEFQKILALDPSNLDARGNLGVLLFFQGKYADAVPELRAVVRVKPDLWKLQALLGMGERHTGDSVDARVDLEKAFPELQEKKVRVDVGLELIELYTATEELDKASAVAGVLLNLDPENQEVLYASYRIHSDLARAAILSLSLVAPKSALMYQVMAHEAARRGDTAAAIQDDREALKLNPKLPGIHFELAEMLNRLPKNAASSVEIESEYEAALAQNPFDEKADLRLGEIAARDNHQQKAFDLYSRAVKLQPDDPEACYELAKILLTMEQPEKAEKLLEHAVQLDPTNAVIHFRLSTVYRRLGRDADAVREVEEYRKYKDLKEQLRETYRELHLDPHKLDMDEGASGKE